MLIMVFTHGLIKGNILCVPLFKLTSNAPYVSHTTLYHAHANRDLMVISKLKAFYMLEYT